MNSLNNASEVSQIVNRFNEIKEQQATLSQQVKVLLEKELPKGYSLSVLASSTLGSMLFIEVSGAETSGSAWGNNHCVSMSTDLVNIHKICTPKIYDDLSKIIHILVALDLTQITETIKIVK